MFDSSSLGQDNLPGFLPLKVYFRIQLNTQKRGAHVFVTARFDFANIGGHKHDFGFLSIRQAEEIQAIQLTVLSDL